MEANTVYALLNAKIDEKSVGPTYNRDEVDTKLAVKQDKLIPGEGISIAADGKTISADSTTDYVELNKEEYDALPQEKKMDGTLYFITDWCQYRTVVYSIKEIAIGTWVDGKTVYQRVIELSDPSAFQKGVAFKVMDKPAGMTMMIKGEGIIKTYEGSYSNSDILVYSTSSAIMAKQNFTGYPEKLWIIIQYIK